MSAPLSNAAPALLDALRALLAPVKLDAAGLAELGFEPVAGRHVHLGKVAAVRTCCEGDIAQDKEQPK